MKVVSGIVDRVRLTAEISGNQHGVSTSQIIGFRIGKQAVQLCMPSLPQIEDGDEVAVAGDVVNGVLVARAYRNFDNNAHAQWRHGWVSSTLISGIFFLPLLALFVLALLRGGTSSPYAILFYVVPFLPFPFWAMSGITQAMKSARAARMVWSVE